MQFIKALFLLGIIVCAGCSDEPAPVVPVPDTIITPSPAVPHYSHIPTHQQLEWQRGELYMFVHFGINTFTDKEWGEGNEDPALFNPTNFNPDQWVQVAKKAGFKGLVFTAKHHEGFALWPTAASTYSIARSPWKNGQGDIVGEVAAACHKGGLKFGVYLSPWDRHESSYGTAAYNDFYVEQLTELLTRYGPIFEVWLDGAHGTGVTPNYDMQRYHRVIRKLQPNALIASFGPDIRWVGNEDGIAPDTMWSVDEDDHWHPTECDVSIRPGWFWHEDENSRLKTEDQLVDIYFSSVGRNSALLLNVPPNREGLLSDVDVALLESFRKRLDNIFANNLASTGSATAGNVRISYPGWSARQVIDGSNETFWTTDDSVSSSWIEISFPRSVSFNTIDIREAVQYGQRVASYRVEAFSNGSWTVIDRGATIGLRKLGRISTIEAEKVRLVIESSKASPVISEFGLYADPGRM